MDLAYYYKRELEPQSGFSKPVLKEDYITEWGQAYDFAILIVKFPLSDVAIV